MTHDSFMFRLTDINFLKVSLNISEKYFVCLINCFFSGRNGSLLFLIIKTIYTCTYTYIHVYIIPSRENGLLFLYPALFQNTHKTSLNLFVQKWDLLCMYIYAHT